MTTKDLIDLSKLTNGRISDRTVFIHDACKTSRKQDGTIPTNLAVFFQQENAQNASDKSAEQIAQNFERVDIDTQQRKDGEYLQPTFVRFIKIVIIFLCTGKKLSHRGYEQQNADDNWEQSGTGISVSGIIEDTLDIF